MQAGTSGASLRKRSRLAFIRMNKKSREQPVTFGEADWTREQSGRALSVHRNRGSCDLHSIEISQAARVRTGVSEMKLSYPNHDLPMVE